MITFYWEWLPLPKEEFNILMMRADKGDEVADALLANVIHIAEVKDFYDNVRCKPSAEMFSMSFEDYNVLKAEMLKILSK